MIMVCPKPRVRDAWDAEGAGAEPFGIVACATVSLSHQQNFNNCVLAFDVLLRHASDQQQVPRKSLGVWTFRRVGSQPCRLTAGEMAGESSDSPGLGRPTSSPSPLSLSRPL